MKTDRELLELAARASGLLMCGYSWIGENEDDDECEILEVAFVKHHQEQELASKWNPLTDDGDALRLAVKLGLCILCHATQVEYSTKNGGVGIVVEQKFRDAAATRRAITRAASAIGEAMQ